MAELATARRPRGTSLTEKFHPRLFRVNVTLVELIERNNVS